MEKKYNLADVILAFDFGMLFVMALIQTIILLSL